MGKQVARVGDSTSHGGTIVSGASQTMVDGKAIARQGDTHECGYWYHGSGEITGGSSTVMVEGKPVARVGDSTDCGAEITGGSDTTMVD
jgi:uncharacterized Zn-binding protein involved in type VI secretion